MPNPHRLDRPAQPCTLSPEAPTQARMHALRRLGNDSERVYVTFKPSDDSNAPGSTPTPEAVPAGDGGQQPAAASGPAARRSGGFPLPLEKGSGHDFWGGGGAGKAPAEEDVVQIPIEGIPDKVCFRLRGMHARAGCRHPFSNPLYGLRNWETAALCTASAPHRSSWLVKCTTRRHGVVSLRCRSLLRGSHLATCRPSGAPDLLPLNSNLHVFCKARLVTAT